MKHTDAIKKIMKENHVKQADIAKALDIKCQPVISRLLNRKAGRVTRILDILDVLGYELVARPRTEEGRPSEYVLRHSDYIETDEELRGVTHTRAIRKILDRQNLTQTEVAKRLNLDHQRVQSRIHSAKVRVCNLLELLDSIGFEMIVQPIGKDELPKGACTIDISAYEQTEDVL